MATPQAYPSHPPNPELRSSSFPKGYVEDVGEVRTQLGIVFTFLPWLVDDAADNPMPIIHDIDQQAR